jgi:hypothetical protein
MIQQGIEAVQFAQLQKQPVHGIAFSRQSPSEAFCSLLNDLNP